MDNFTIKLIIIMILGAPTIAGISGQSLGLLQTKDKDKKVN